MDGTALGTLLGFLASLLPVILDRYLGTSTPSTSSTNGQVTDGDFIPGADDAPVPQADKRIPYVALDVLRASVRPVLTYGFFLLYAVVKLGALGVAVLVQRTAVGEVLPLVWDESAEMVFATVVSFWFGSRLLTRWKR